MRAFVTSVRVFKLTVLAAVLCAGASAADGGLGGRTGAASLAGGATRCVGPGARCFRTLAAAVKAARDGDTILLARGTYAGAVIDKSITVIGAGARATTLSGGGPVLTIGRGKRRGLDVSISKLTITGGLSRSSPLGGCGPDIPECGPGIRGQPPWPVGSRCCRR